MHPHPVLLHDAQNAPLTTVGDSYKSCQWWPLLSFVCSIAY
ncbi:hypothetical protein AS9A_4203 [Hoyosella subflava DQS3-9A1]|uniref:Uncharacterized protein n=1 Tax=Hoyosella subflava (strain DSM 45089 / JCM 17490 / NBRC 109087 / DQS3-9A1) TaxID=443218 RepID=F6EK95_HOYSD|nr:hypothetical protein AS9A_4203 [Hoyosella subflava DQS3-9A1]